MSLKQYLSNVVALQQQFICLAAINNAEAEKIFSRWVITHRSLFHQGNNKLFLPKNPVFDVQLIHELIEKGCPQMVAHEVEVWLRKQTALVHTEPVKKKNALEVKKIEGDTTVTLEGQPITLTLNREIYRKLEEKHSVLEDIYQCVLFYNQLQGKGLQWALPPRLFSYLERKLQCTTEVFASPINHYYSRYYSLFEVDKSFGSLGSFFDAPNSEFESGCFQVNPPFIDSIFTKTTQRILSLLQEAKAAERELTFVYVMPLWTQFRTVNWVSDSPFCVRYIQLKPDSHFYYQAETDSYIRARFTTVMFILSSVSEVGSKVSNSEISYLFSYKKN